MRKIRNISARSLLYKSGILDICTFSCDVCKEINKKKKETRKKLKEKLKMIPHINDDKGEYIDPDSFGGQSSYSR